MAGVGFFGGGAKATIYRGMSSVLPNVDVDVQETKFVVKPEQNRSASNFGSSSHSNEFITHNLFFDIVDVGTYRPLLDDRVVVSGSPFGQLDGDYIVKQYPMPEAGLGGIFNELDHFELRCRFVGPKKPGDVDPHDNAGNVRTGPRNRAD